MIPHFGVINSALSTVVPTDRAPPDHCAAAMDQSPSAPGTFVHIDMAEVRRGEQRFRSHVAQACAGRADPQQPRRSFNMKTHLPALAAGIFLLAGAGVAAAQTVVIAPEQETVIREFVKKKPIASIDLPGVELNIGSTVPETVEIHKIDAPDITYSYTVVGGRTYVVEPGTRKIVHVLD
jgi:hypothetical protein